MADELRRSPLDAAHRARDARMVEFGGWDMPIQYGGVLEEHRACRSGSVVFDVSHLGSVRVQGAGALDALQWAFTNDLGRIAPGQAQYTHLLDAVDAHVVDDVIVWWVAADDFIVMPNASNTDPIVASLRDAAARVGATATVLDVTRSRAVLAVQGPHARAALATIPDLESAAQVARFSVAAFTWGDVEGYVAGTGYTGEDGVELHIPAAAAPALWDAIVAAGVTPAGLGARDTLRLEAGLPLHGHELGEGITPLQAGLGWVVRFDKGDFLGREALLAERDRGISRRLRAILLEDRRPPRAGCPVLVDGAVIGVVTSGNVSPMLQRGIALAFVPPDMEVGTQVDIDIRGTLAAGTIVKLPFV